MTEPSDFSFPRLSNWGKWGPNDELGAANYITPEVILNAMKLVRGGKVISCAIPLDRHGPVHPARGVPEHWMRFGAGDYALGAPSGGKIPEGGVKFSDDGIHLSTQSTTQWDGLAHAWYGTQMYNGFSETYMRNPNFGGLRRLDIGKFATHFVTRGVLLDVLRRKGAEALQGSAVITAADLEATAAAQKVEIKSGDALLVRTGNVPFWYSLKDKSSYWKDGHPGLGIDTAVWIHEHEVAAVAADNVSLEVEPSRTQHPDAFYPLHAVLLRDLGVMIGELFDLERLSEDCADDGVYEFLFIAQPLNIKGGIGSPINPLAIK